MELIVRRTVVYAKRRDQYNRIVARAGTMSEGRNENGNTITGTPSPTSTRWSGRAWLSPAAAT